MAPELAAHRLEVMAHAYDGGHSAVDIAQAVVPRIERSIAVMTDGAAAGDPGLQRLVELGAPGRTSTSLDALRTRMPAVLDVLRR
jgi:hypothetical protein